MPEEFSVGGIVGTVVAVVFTIGAGLWGCPQYNVYNSELQGKAALAQANFSREIAVREAQAKLDAANLLNQAEVARAKGLAAAAEIVMAKLGTPEAYLRYLMIQSLDHAKPTLIYVPTEANLPILEAQRKPPQPQQP